LDSINKNQVGKVFTALATGKLKERHNIICGSDFDATKKLCCGPMVAEGAKKMTR